jgi:CheY-like chemotaxis protein
MHDDEMPTAGAFGAAPPASRVGAAFDEPVIDPEAITRLRELDPSGQQGVLRRVLHAYEASLARHLGDIASARDGADLDRLMRAVHTLKSSSAAVGAMAFSQRCADIARAAGRRRRGDADAHGAALRERGFVVREVDSGRAALEALAEGLPDVIVLDAIMPELDGFDTCRALRAMPGGENVPVLMLTGLDDDASITRAYEAGATDFFVKSTQWSLLAGRLRYLLRASRTRIELERSKSKLARAQDLARMGSFDWRRQRDRPGCRPRRCASSASAPARCCRCVAAAHGAGRATAGCWCACCEQCASTARCWPPTCRSLLTWTPAHHVVHVEAEPEFNEHGQMVGYTGIVQDVTDRRVAEDKIRHLANFDALTGLPNRRQLIWRAERALEHGPTPGPPVRAAADRPGPLQDHQRHAGPPPATNC